MAGVVIHRFDRRIEHDLDYIENWSLLRDLKILLVTLFGGFHDRGCAILIDCRNAVCALRAMRVKCRGVGAMVNINKLLDWWQRGVIAALGISILLLGIGRLEFSSFSLSAWSVSRTTFFFWFLGKLLLLYHRGWAGFELRRLSGLAPLSLIFSCGHFVAIAGFSRGGRLPLLCFCLRACRHGGRSPRRSTTRYAGRF